MAVTKEQMAELTSLLSEKTNETQDIETEEAETIVEPEEVETEEAEKAENTETEQPVTDEADKKYTPKEMAEAIGWEAKDFYDSLLIPMDDGQDPVSLGEIKNNYQNLNRDFKSLQDEKAQLEQGQVQGLQEQQISNEMMQARVYLESINKMESDTNWQELEELDPTEAVLKRDKIRRARDEAINQINTIGYQQQQAFSEYLNNASKQMIELIPSWSDETVKSGDFGTIKSLMGAKGFSSQEVDSISDPRIMGLLKELIDLRALKEVATTAAKKVKGAPQVLAGSRGIPATANLDKVKQLVGKAKNTGNKNDELAAVKALLGAK